MTENDPKPLTLAALLLATVALPPLVAATVLRGEPEAPAPHVAFCSDAGPAARPAGIPNAPVAPVRPAKSVESAPILACGPAVSTVTP